MKKVIALLLALLLVLAFVGCGKSEEVKNVEALIASIGEISIDSETLIGTVQEQYDALTDKEKEKVENYDILIKAHETLDEAKKTKEEEQYASIYSQAAAYEEAAELQLAYQEYEKLPEDYEDTAERKAFLAPYIEICGFWTYVNHVGSYAPEFYSLEVDFIKSREDISEYTAELTYYDARNFIDEKELSNTEIEITDEYLVFSNVKYRDVFGMFNKGNLRKEFKFTGNTLTFTYYFDEGVSGKEENIGSYIYERADAPKEFS